MARSLGRTGRRWRTARALLMATRPDICTICGHPGRANEAHHVPSLKVLERLGLDPCDQRYLFRAHGVKRCPTCNRACNQSQGDKTTPPAHKTSRAW